MLAESWEFDKDKLEFTIHLRKGVKWHPMQLPSGKMLPAKEFTARDVKFTFDCILNQNIEAASHPELFRGSGRQGRLGAVQNQSHGRRRPYGEGPLDEALFPGRGFHAGSCPSSRRHVFSVDEQRRADLVRLRQQGIRRRLQQPLGEQADVRHRSDDLQGLEEARRRAGSSRNPDYWGPPYAFSQVLDRCVTNP